MKTNVTSNSKHRVKASGFTLIEMIGVLAVIAILAAVLIPKVFEAISNSRVNNTAMSCNTVKTAVADHYAKFGTLLSDNGTAITSGFPIQFDAILLKEGFLDKPFTAKIGAASAAVAADEGADPPVYASGGAIRVDLLPGAATVNPGNSGYDLDGAGGSDTPDSSYVVHAVIPGVLQADAAALNERIDGPLLAAADATSNDVKGRVKYAGSFPTTVYVYLTHR